VRYSRRPFSPQVRSPGVLFVRPMSALALSAWAMDDEGTRNLEFRDSLYKATVAGALH